METYLYRLNFNSPVHFGASGIGLEITKKTLSSDALTSALINSFAVFGEADQVITALKQEKPAFVMSSLFPFFDYSNGRIEYLLPRPLTSPKAEKELLKSKAKDLKKIEYLQANCFFSWIGEKPLDTNMLEDIIDVNKDLTKDWWKSELRPRVALDRISQNSAIWSCGVLHFQQNAGLYGLIRFENELWKNKLTAAFKLLGELGLGGERTYGMGTFSVSEFEPLKDVWNKIPYTKGKFVLLSSFFPADDECSGISKKFEAWNFVENRGYIVSGRMATTLKRKRLNMMVEGSVAKEVVKGKMVEVTPDDAQDLGLTHSVYRSGLAFLMPLPVKGADQ